MGKPANYDQDSFRYRNNDGSESGATWKYTVNNNGDLDVNTSYRMRLLVQEFNGGAGNDVDLEFGYNLNSAGWNVISTTSSVVKAVASSHFTNGDDCTQQLGSGTFITDNDGMTEDGISGGTMLDFAGRDESETELCFQIVSGDVADGDTIEIALRRDGGISLESYTNIPSISVNKPGYTLDCNAGAFTLAGISTNLLTSRVIDTVVGDFVLAGIDVDLLVSRQLDANVGTFALAGIAIDLLAGRILTADVGDFALSGIDTGLLISRRLSVVVGAFSLVGVDTGLLVSKLLDVNVGEFLLAGIDVDLIYSGTGAYQLDAEVGNFSLTGVAANVRRGYTLAAATISFVLTGIDSDLICSRIVSAGIGAYTLIGVDAGLLAQRLLNANAGAFDLAGIDSNILANRKIVAGAGSYLLTGVDADLIYGGGPVFPTGWKYRMPITIDHNQVASDLTDWTFVFDQAFDSVLTSVNGPLDADGNRAILNGGGDVRFTSDLVGSNRLAVDVRAAITNNNPLNGELELAVKIPALSSSIDTTIYMWWGKTGVSQPVKSDTYGQFNAYDSNHEIVMNFRDWVDRTSHEYDFDSTVGDPTIGNASSPIGRYAAFDGDDIKSTTASVNHGIGSGDFMHEAFARRIGTMANIEGIGSNSQYDPAIVFKSLNKWGAYFSGFSESTIHWPDLTNYYNAVLNRVSGVMGYYLAGAACGTRSVSAAVNDGVHHLGGGSATTGMCSNGRISEYKFHKASRSAGWIKANHDNLVNTSGLITFGEIEAVLYGLVAESASYVLAGIDAGLIYFKRLLVDVVLIYMNEENVININEDIQSHEVVVDSGVGNNVVDIFANNVEKTDNDDFMIVINDEVETHNIEIFSTIKIHEIKVSLHDDVFCVKK
jgi:hypothetical protein